ncbi:unnamed protein product [Notodromas monacha]|uniref:SWI/SNF-related matrix-associated actin-dependent regulator of chromatin subfamily A containing DEAD/H box 1 homolog n=1 Tax=Notodromas monacha TaxID=399045 RepID=A0A7R9BQD7_9CRUS|nr:unnamed protein product [Notodromas monacha]CAG0918409.1 unnamed protein product [Notodromas monacha]
MDSSKGSVNAGSSLRNFRIQRQPLADSPNLSENSNREQISSTKRAQIMSSNESDDSVGFQSTQKRRRVVFSSDDDGDNESRTNRTESAGDIVPDSELVESQIEELKKSFPQISDLDVQDALKEAEWNVEDAAVRLRQKAARNNSSKKNDVKKKGRVRVNSEDSDDDGPNGGDFDAEDEDDGYRMESRKVYDSDDSDDESLLEDRADRNEVVEFLEIATKEELSCMIGSSSKKADVIIEMRPLANWADLVLKIRSHKSVSLDILNSVKDTLKVRRDVARLLSKCERISVTLQSAVERLMNNSEDVPKSESRDLFGQPSLLNREMKLTQYQILGLNWLNLMRKNKLNGILADEMGLGKTIQVIAFVALIHEQGDVGPHLIIVPPSTLDNWVREFGLWCPSLEICTYVGSQIERKQLRISLNEILSGKSDDAYPNVIITTYNTATSTPEDKVFVKRMPFHYVIFDEAHMLKNCATQRFEHLMRIQAKRRILLTGTPMQNSLRELMSLLIFVMPNMFASHRTQLLKTFALYPRGADGTDADENLNTRSNYERERIQQARRIMNPFILRRLKKDVLRDLPPKSEEVIRAPMDAHQQKLYDKFLKSVRDDVTAAKENGTLTGGGGIAIMMQLRKLANHPLLMRFHYDTAKLRTLTKLLLREPVNERSTFDVVLEELSMMSDFEINSTLRMYPNFKEHCLPDSQLCSSGKLQALDRILPGLIEQGTKALLFSQFVIVLNILEAYIKIRGYRYVRFDGSTPREERQRLIDEFNNDPKLFIFLLTTRSGGQGINLTGANTVILHDVDFNPHNDKQAEDRCHRVGQKKPVRVIRLISKDTIEEGMYRLAQEKLKLEEDLGGRTAAEEEGGEDVKPDSKDVVRLLHDYLRMDVIPNGMPK